MTTERKNVEKDHIVAKLIPEKISECSTVGPNAGACFSEQTLGKIAEKLKISAPKHQILEKSKEILGCDSAKCTVDKLSIDIGKDVMNFKVHGPIDNTLLSNYNIDAVMHQYAARFKDFYPYNFNMLNYMDYSFKNGNVLNEPDSLATIQFADLYKSGFRRAGCVINTDVYQGNGKHWMALFVDSAGPTVEFFNSSGNSPAPEWISYLVKTRDQLNNCTGKQAQIIKVTTIRQQQSKTECGVYSLFYIWARLNGVSYKYFMDVKVPDQLMFEFRQHIFEGSPYENMSFDFEEYAEKFPLKWEK